MFGTEILQPIEIVCIIVWGNAMNLDQEKQLVESIKRDKQNFGLLFDYAYPRVFRYIMRRTGNYDLSQDLAAETFLKAYLKIDRFTWKNISVMAWLYRIASNETNANFRSRKSVRFDYATILNPEVIRQASPEEDS